MPFQLILDEAKLDLDLRRWTRRRRYAGVTLSDFTDAEQAMLRHELTAIAQRAAGPVALAVLMRRKDQP